jgi:beta-galactosidase
MAFPQTFDKILYGAAYYPEYMRRDRVTQDISMMREAGLSVIRVGESTWTHWEPREGEFQFEWMQRVLDCAHAADIKVILGVPTYSIPPWLHQRYPDILATKWVDATPRLQDPFQPTFPASEAPGEYGPRQNQDYTHPEFRRYARRITAEIVGYFSSHPAIVGYQVDNETSPNGVPTKYSEPLFKEHLIQKFKSPEKLNSAWNLAFWGQSLASWAELPSRCGAINPGYKLEWDRFQQGVITDYLKELTAEVRRHAQPDQFVTHDFVGGAVASIDQWAISEVVDIPAANIYYSTQEKMDGATIWFCGDFARSLRKAPYLVTETNAQSIGWDSRTQYPHFPGQMRLAVMAHIAAGAAMVGYWHWASAYNGKETFWRGILGHDLLPNRTYAEVSEIGRDLQRVGSKLAGLQIKPKVAIVYSADADNALRHMPFSDDVNYGVVLDRLYQSLYSLNLAVDIVPANLEDLDQYTLLIVPPLYVATDEQLERIDQFVASGGRALVLFKSGFTDSDSSVRELSAPGPLRPAAGCYYQEFSSLAKPVALKPDRYNLGVANRAAVWSEWLVPESAEVLFSLDHPGMKYPVVTRNRYGDGELVYQGTLLEPEAQTELIRELAESAGLLADDGQLPESVKVRHAMGQDGGAIHFYFNFGPDEVTFAYPYAAAVDLFAEETVTSNHSLNLEPWSCRVLSETSPSST